MGAVWLIVATISGALAGGEILLRHVRGGSDLGRARTRLAVGQFLPCVVAGAALTAVLFRSAPEARWMLPGLWSVLFGLGIFSSRPVLPRAFTWLAAGYVAAGFAVLILARGESAFSPLAMGVPFGAGQLAAGVLLYLTLEGGHERG